MSISFDEIQAEAITLGRALGLYPALTIDGAACRLSDQKGNFVSFPLHKSNLEMSIADFGSAVIKPALIQLAAKAKST